MRREEFVDFHQVADDHLSIHARLLEWARWVQPRRQGWPVSPMFRQFRSKAWQWAMPVVRSPVDELRALEVERVVAQLPEAEKMALRWSYVFCGGPGPIARHLGVSKEGLAELVRRGRAMLRNRGVA